MSIHWNGSHFFGRTLLLLDTSELFFCEIDGSVHYSMAGQRPVSWRYCRILDGALTENQCMFYTDYCTGKGI